jgi:predicted nucleic acid-binding Zn finger protein
MTDEGWACSCPNFTRHTPRTDCKHILNIKLKEGLGVPKAQTKLANVAEKTLKEFEQWQREKAARKAGPATAGDAKLNLFGSTGRKFR